MRRAVGPLLASVVLFVVGLMVAGGIYYSDTVGSNELSIYRIFFLNARQVKPVSVDNASWQLALLVQNDGNVDYNLNMVYINGEAATEFGLIHGDVLSSRSVIGTSIPVDGLVISPGITETISVWIGSDRFSQGTKLIVELQKPNQLALQKTVLIQ